MKAMERTQKGAAVSDLLRNPLIAINAIMYILLLVLIIVYLTVHESLPVETCATPMSVLNQPTSQEIVAIVYFALFTMVCLCLFVGVALYGLRLLSQLNKRKGYNKNLMIITLSVMGICSISLLLEAFYLISRLTPWSWTYTATFIFLLFTDGIPICGFLYQFRKPKGMGKGREQTIKTATYPNTQSSQDPVSMHSRLAEGDDVATY